jgi:hypothetical protein
MAFREAWVVKSVVLSLPPLDEMRRSLMPLRRVIHSSVVSTMLSRSLLDSILFGIDEPVPMIHVWGIISAISTPLSDSEYDRGLGSRPFFHSIFNFTISQLINKFSRDPLDCRFFF